MLLLSLCALTACAGGRFQNNYIAFEPRGIGDLIRWKWEAWRNDRPPAPRAPTPRVAPDLAFLRANAAAGASMQPSLTWIGHASSLVQAGGLTVLTDPIFSERASPLAFAGPKRHVPPGIALADLPHVDVVVISHNHYDHLDGPSVDALAKQAGGSPRFVVPLGVAAWFRDRGISDVVELGWWQSERVGTTEIVFVPTQHWSGRGLGDRLETLWGGYAVFSPGFQWFFAGDTAYSRDFADIHARFAARHAPAAGFDLALIPVGAYEPRWFMKSQHVDPAEAVQIHVDVTAARSVGVHWGTFQLTDEALDAPPAALAAAVRERGLDAAAFTTMAVGETRRYPLRR